MRDSGGGDLTYVVTTDELSRAASSVESITETARAATIEDLPRQASTLGHVVLSTALDDFCARWDTGLSHLVGDSDSMAQRLRASASGYANTEAGAEADYRRQCPTRVAASLQWPPSFQPQILRTWSR